jgi:tetratricopeptide (TPR) repeat protein
MRSSGITIVFGLLLLGLAVSLWLAPIRKRQALEGASLTELQAITQREPGNTRAYTLLGQRLMQAGQPGPAFEALARAAELAPDDSGIWIAAARAANAANGPQGAYNILSDFQKRHPNNPAVSAEIEGLFQAMMQTAETYRRRGEVEAARHVYRLALAIRPDYAPAHQGLGLLLLTEGKKTPAFGALTVAVRNDPNLVEARLALATLYFEAGFHPEGTAQLKEATRLQPENARAWHMLGRMTSGASPQEAEAALQRAVMLEPKNVPATLDLAAMQAVNQKLEEAEASYRRALELAPQDPTTLEQTAGFLITARPTPERREEAEKLARKALTADPKNGDAVYHLGRIALDRGDAKAAVTFLEMAIRLPLAADASAAWYALSRAYSRCGERAKAETAQRRARQIREARFVLAHAEEQAFINPNDPARRLQAARLYALQGEYVKAISQYRGCLALAPDKPTATRCRRELETLTARLQAQGKMPDMRLFEAMAATAR